ncbi:hypothetical protein ACFW5U_25640 [Streptomyces rochei]|uniref:hypothetical protein n=1 Tax=Streptomyces rochei TaxID=1928 RepID=UPI003466FDEB
MLGVYPDVLHRTGQRLGAGGTGTRGPWNETPVPVTPTELLGQGGITVHAVQPNGDGALVFAPDDPAADADQALDDLNIWASPMPVPASSWRPARFEDYRDGPVSLREDGASPVSQE